MDDSSSPAMSRYEAANQTRQTGIGNLAFQKFQSGQSGLLGSVGAATRERLAASSVGLKEKFDPLNMVQGLTGSKLLTAAAGKAMGRKAEDVDYFNKKADPNYFKEQAARGPSAAPPSGAPSGGAGGDSPYTRAGTQDRILRMKQDQVATQQLRYFDAIFKNKTILLRGENGLIEGLSDLYDLIDERMPIAGGAIKSEPEPDQQAKQVATTGEGGGSSLLGRGANALTRLGGKAMSKLGGAASSVFGKAKGFFGKGAGAAAAGATAIGAGGALAAGAGGAGASAAADIATKGAGEAGEGAAKGGAKAISKEAIKAGATKIAGKAIPKLLGKSIPIIGAVAGLGFAVSKLMQGDLAGAGIEAVSGLGGPITAIPATILAIANDLYTDLFGIAPGNDPEAGSRFAMIYDGVKGVVEDMIKDIVEPAKPEGGEAGSQATAVVAAAPKAEAVVPERPGQTISSGMSTEMKDGIATTQSGSTMTADNTGFFGGSEQGEETDTIMGSVMTEKQGEDGIAKIESSDFLGRRISSGSMFTPDTYQVMKAGKAMNVPKDVFMKMKEAAAKGDAKGAMQILEDYQKEMEAETLANPSADSSGNISGGTLGDNISSLFTLPSSKAKSETDLESMEAIRKANAAQSAPITILPGDPAPQQAPAPPQSAPASATSGQGSATSNGTVNRFEDKLMGGNADYLP